MCLQKYDLELIHIKGCNMYIAYTLSDEHSTFKLNDLFDHHFSVVAVDPLNDDIKLLANETKK